LNQSASPLCFFVVCLFSKIRSHYVTQAALNLWSSYLSLLNACITAMYHHAWHSFWFSSVSLFCF
jgi:hypothetical protein